MSDQDAWSGLKSHLGEYATALGRKALSSAGDKVDGLTDRLEGSGGSAGEAAKKGAEKMSEGKSPVTAAASGLATGAADKAKSALGGGSGGSGGAKKKFMNIVEWTDVGVPLKVAYNAFTQYEDWPDYMKKVEHVDWDDDAKLTIKGQVFLSHRTWEATITEQVPDSHIVWESTGEKGSISGSVSFHEVTPTLTRMLTIGEYHPQGFVEKTGNLWRAVGRRFRLELKFFVHHVMTDVMIDPDSVEGWRGEIRDGEVVTTHEEALEQEQQEAQESESEEEQESEEAEPESEEEPPAEDEAEELPAEDEEEELPAEDAEEEPPAEEEEPVDEEEAPAEEEEEEPPADAEEEPAEEEEPPADEEPLEEEETVPEEEAEPEEDVENEDEPVETEEEE
ncbi:SRPBCC family protein [Nesterenkonia natronophila]|uniref:SRPBCC family protein n=1 Tax=Nesterenkonia natronophila TaxID=2174932 RepID=A0A3A4F936_9MICC|nr:SRPBCC family protein [Nesterenkonia natronophila]RJN33000.1 SRPBCC family protein [Nesterenkonia natronophila]